MESHHDSGWLRKDAMQRYEAAIGNAQGDTCCLSPLALRYVGAMVMAVCLLASSAAVARSAQPRRILIVNSYHKEFEWTDAQVAGAREVLTSAIDDLELYVEYLDTKRIAFEGDYADLLSRTLRLKYKDVKLDAIITTDDNALRLVMKLHEDVFRGVPVAFCGVNDYQPSLLAGRDQFTGLVEVLDIKPTIDLAMKLHPNTRKVVVIVDDTPTGMGQRRDVAIVAAQCNELHFEYLKSEDLTHDELLAKLAALDSDSIVLLTVWLRDKTGAFLAPDTEGPRISESSTVPVYGIIDMYLDYGIVGGKLLNSRTHGRMAAEMVVRILNGERPADIPVVIESVNPYMFDSRQLSRWGIHEHDLPEGSTISHRPFSFYEEYNTLIWRVMVSFTALVFLLLLLSASAIRRKRVEKALRESETINRTLLEGSPVCNKVIDLDSKLRYMSTAGQKDLKITDIKPCYGQTYPPDFFPESARAPLIRGLEAAKEGITSSVEVLAHDIEGNEVWFHTTFVPAVGDDGQVKFVIGSSVNITERKQKEEEVLALAKFPSENPAPVLRFSAEGKLLYSNDASESLRSVWQEDPNGPIAPQWQQIIQDSLAKGQPQRQEFECEGCAYSITFAPVAEGQYVNVYAIDITERKRGVEALRESEERMRAIADYTYDWESWLAMDGRLAWINPAVEKLTGYSQQDCHEMSDYPLPIVHEEDRAEFANRLRRAVADEDSINDHGFRIRCKDGSVRWMAISWQPIYGEPNHCLGLRTSVRDITDRKRNEEDISALAKFPSENPAPVLRFSAEGKLLYSNDASESLRSVWQEDPNGPIAPQWQQIIQDSLAKGQPQRQEFECEGCAYSITFAPVAEGQYVNVYAIDITERKRAEEERLSLERQVQHAQKLESLGVLAGGIAHDFNNLLMAILGNANLALYELSTHAPARENILEIEKASKRAAELAKQMLAYSGKGKFVIEPIYLGEFVKEMAHLLGISVSKKAVLKYNFADNLPTFDGDATQIRQIIMNLITNASEAIGDKSGVIALSTGAMDCDRAYLDCADEALRAGLDEPLPEGLYVYFEVADTGCGMDAETIKKVFDPFFTTKFTGRGLGMAAVLGIVRGHHGAIQIYSEPGKGTTFKILFPASGLPEDDGKIQRLDIDEAELWHGHGTILIADDEETVCAVGKRMLNRMGFSVLTADDGNKAVEVFREHADEIGCVILDLTMPHMGGEDAFHEMRSVRPDVKVILSSGYNEQDATQRFAGSGLAGFIQKPYSMATLKEKLGEVLPGDMIREVIPEP